MTFGNYHSGRYSRIVRGLFNPDYALGSVMRDKNARKSSIYRMRHSTAMVNELNEAKRLILKHFEIVIGSLMHITGLSNGRNEKHPQSL